MGIGSTITIKTTKYRLRSPPRGRIGRQTTPWPFFKLTHYQQLTPTAGGQVTVGVQGGTPGNNQVIFVLTRQPSI